MSGLIFKIYMFLIFAAGHQPAADHILDPFEIFGLMVASFDGSMVRWFHGSMVRWFHCSMQTSTPVAIYLIFSHPKKQLNSDWVRVWVRWSSVTAALCSQRFA